MTKHDWKVIKCPHCGAEYLPSEIFYPDDLIVDARDIIKDEEGKIVFAEVDETSYEETYWCDHCGKEFTVKAKLDFELVKKAQIDFTDEF